MHSPLSAVHYNCFFFLHFDSGKIVAFSVDRFVQRLECLWGAICGDCCSCCCRGCRGCCCCWQQFLLDGRLLVKMQIMQCRRLCAVFRSLAHLRFELLWWSLKNKREKEKKCQKCTATFCAVSATWRATLLLLRPHSNWCCCGCKQSKAKKKKKMAVGQHSCWGLG